jgi:hypothetical protein
VLSLFLKWATELPKKKMNTISFIWMNFHALRVSMLPPIVSSPQEALMQIADPMRHIENIQSKEENIPLWIKSTHN